MAPTPTSAKLTLSYPLYAVDFDPNNSDRLVVGGGGGVGRSGVSNKLTVLDTSHAEEVTTIAEAEISKDEDSVMSLAVGPTKGNTTLIYAGANSGEDDPAEGKNQHLRTFAFESAPAAKKATTGGATVSELSRAKLFENKDKDSYQRVLRLSRPYPNSPQLGAAATGVAGTVSQQPEIVLFDTTGPGKAAPKLRGRVGLGHEANDVDIIQTGDGSYMFAYCTNYEVYVDTISATPTDRTPVPTYIVPGSVRAPISGAKEGENPKLPSFRCIRFLTPEFVVLLTNIWGRNGVVVMVMRITSDDPKLKGKVASSIRLPAGIKSATSLAVSNLSPPTSPGEAQGNGQFLIAVASSDISITLLTAEYQLSNNVQYIPKLKVLQTLKAVHPLQITGLAFSNFTPPANGSKVAKPLKLASISMGNTLVVHTLPLKPYTNTDDKDPSGKPKTNYAIKVPSPEGPPLGLIMLCAVTMLIAVIMQVTLEIRGVSPSYTGLREGHIQPDVVKVLKSPYLDRVLGPIRDVKPKLSGIPKVENVAGKTDFAKTLEDLKAKSAAAAESQDGTADAPVVIIRDVEAAAHSTDPELATDGGVKAHLHDEAADGPHGGKEWHELSDKEKERWTRKLRDAGHWVEDYGETLFKGVLFGTIGGAIGAAVG